jgi:uncharacterized protein YchJ|tara:strand:- start:32 stop:937 length:906 start_codon:yes stop_codon:yes gene_type:complete
MSKKKGDPQVLPEGTIRVTTNGTKWIKENGKWVYMKKPKNEWISKNYEKDAELIRTLFVEGKTYDEITKLAKCSKTTVAKYCQGLKVKFPPVKLPDHIKPTNYPRYYISNDGIAYREPRPRDAYGRHGEINEWGLIEMTTHLRGNPYNMDKCYHSVNIYFYDENDKNVDFKKKNIHQLVAETWVPNPHGYNEILHLDDNCKNNHYTNLKWGTHKENMAYKHLPEGTVRKYKGKSSTYVKKNGEWVLVPSNKPVWNRGLKGSSWNTLPDGTVSIRRVNSGYGKFIKQDGKWVYQGKTEVDKG